MSNKIKENAFNDTMVELANYLSWETDVKKIESALVLWSHFQMECEKPEFGSRWEEAQRLLRQVVTEYAS